MARSKYLYVIRDKRKTCGMYVWKYVKDLNL